MILFNCIFYLLVINLHFLAASTIFNLLPAFGFESRMGRFLSINVLFLIFHLFLHASVWAEKI